ncbi:MAG: insulinase family protein, partial [Magnetococcales bacterium]|nr:insulinase family protein [Magnetococcales bacterium]
MTNHHPNMDPTAAIHAAIPEPEYQISTLANGLTVATFPMPWLHEVGVTILVRGGSRYELEKHTGVAHFLEHMLFRGTERMPNPTQLHTHLEAMAADMNAATGHEVNAYWMTLPLEQLPQGMHAFCEMITQPAFTGIDSERGVILAEMREDENDRGEMVNALNLASEQLWPNHPLARPILGFRESVTKIATDDLWDYLRRLYRGGNMATAFFGPIQHAEAQALAETHLGKLPNGSIPLSP